METIAERKPNFTKAQIEVLNAVAHLHSEEEVMQLKQVISHFFFERANQEMDKLWESGDWNEETLRNLRHSHYRTPYSR